MGNVSAEGWSATDVNAAADGNLSAAGTFSPEVGLNRAVFNWIIRSPTRVNKGGGVSGFSSAPSAGLFCVSVEGADNDVSVRVGVFATPAMAKGA